MAGSSGNETADFSHDTDNSIDESSEEWEFDGEHEIFARMGAQFQASLPDLRDRSCHELVSSHDDSNNLMWDPYNGDNQDSKIESYQNLSCSAAVKGGGRNVEYAMHLLHLKKGNILEAVNMLISNSPPKLPVGHPMLDYKYQESDSWSSEEMERFYKSIIIHGRDFFKVSKDVGSKSIRQCVEFYYFWKKADPNFYTCCVSSRKTQDHQRMPDNTTKKHPHNFLLNSMKTNPHNTRWSTKRAAEAAAQIAPETAAQIAPETAEQMAADIVNIIKTHPKITNAAHQGWEQEVVGMSDGSSLTHKKTNRAESQSLHPESADSTYNTIPADSSWPMLPGLQFSCNFEECQMRYCSKPALQSHIRKHKQKLQSSPRLPARPSVYNQHGEEIFPCRLCDRVFAKVKSRSAHMKSHKMAAMTQSENTHSKKAITVKQT